MAGRKKERTIFREILLPLVSVLCVEMVFMAGTIVVGGVTDKLNQNAMDILAQQTENRKNYLSGEMVARWSELEELSDAIDAEVEAFIGREELILSELNKSGSGSVRLLKELKPKLIDAMYDREVSGIYVLFYTGSLEEAGDEPLTGVYLRDLDPRAAPSERYADLLWERAPVGVVQSGNIATDVGWQPSFSREDSLEQDFFRCPFEAAASDARGLSEKEYGYWTSTPYQLTGDGRSAISYSVPLVLKDGTVYGVLGVELLSDYMKTLLPNAELMEENLGSYVLAAAFGDEAALTPVVVSSDTTDASQVQALGLALDESGESAKDAAGDHYASAKRLVLYSNNAPFDAQRWYLLGMCATEDLFAFSGQVRTLLLLSMAMTFFIGLAGIVLASARISRPIRRLFDEVAGAQRGKAMPVLSPTGIREIDRLADSITGLGREVVESSTRLLGIMDMASVELAGYELKDGAEYAYVTDNYFPLLGGDKIDADVLRVEEFLALQGKRHEALEHFESKDGSVVYSVPQEDGSVRYLRYEYQKKDGRQIGLIEDVTASTLERMRIERERDSDNLTKLFARRGFKREADRLFLQPERLKCAGLLMIDLDNLKTTNDRFGHEFGDLYIQTAGRCFVENTPKDTLCARMSGDEFIVFFYGYDSIDEIREYLAALYRAIGEVEFVLPNGDNMGLSASGGIAWYPGDATELSDLMKYADFAMYQVKRSKKGTYTEFNETLYRREQIEIQRQREQQ